METLKATVPFSDYIKLEKEIETLKAKIDEKVLEEVEEITYTNYEIENYELTGEKAVLMIEDLLKEIKRLNDEKESDEYDVEEF